MRNRIVNDLLVARDALVATATQFGHRFLARERRIPSAVRIVTAETFAFDDGLVNDGHGTDVKLVAIGAQFRLLSQLLERVLLRVGRVDDTHRRYRHRPGRESPGPL